MPSLEETARKDVRLDRLAKALKVPPAEFQLALDLGGVQVNGKRVHDARLKVTAGSAVFICHGETPPTFVFDASWILHEDDTLLVWNKTAGMTTQGTRCFDVGHLYAFAKEHVGGYVALHHRLDRETSGVVIMCKDREQNKALADQFSGRSVKKEYLAIVHGVVPKTLTLEAPMGPLPQLKPTRHAVNVPDAKPAATEVVRLAGSDRFSLVLAKPRTGRTHQVRVHLASAGFPIVGDAFYNAGEPMRNLRTLLHCRRMELVHPGTGNPVSFEAPVPEDMDRFLDDQGIMVPEPQ